MASFPRRMQRKKARASSDYAGRPQPFVPTDDGGYRTLRPTKGWVYISGPRLRAQRRMALMMDRHFAPSSPKMRQPKPHEHRREIARHLRQLGSRASHGSAE